MSRIVAVRVKHPGTHEQHITDFKTATDNIIPKTSMIVYIESWGGVYYTSVDGKRANLIVVEGPDGIPYVKTEADDTTVNNLLNLPRF